MAIYHFYLKDCGRNQGRSAVAAAAYRSGSRIENMYDGVTHDYSKKRGVVHTEIILPPYAPKEYRDRNKLWNAVEMAEKAKNARLFREVEIALPIELTRDRQIKLARDFVKNTFVDDGMCADICIHDPPLTDDKGRMLDGNGNIVKDEALAVHRNPHAHVMLTIRPIDPDTGEWGKKTEAEYICIKNGEEKGFTAKELEVAKADGWEKQYCYKVGSKKVWLTASEGERKKLKRTTNTAKASKFGREVPIVRRWNDPDNMFMWREKWALYCNTYLYDNGFTDTYIDAGRKKIDPEYPEMPMISQSRTAKQIDKRAECLSREGISAPLSYSGQVNQEIKKYNTLIRRMKKELSEFMASVRSAINEVRTKLETLRVSVIVSEYSISDMEKSLAPEILDKYKRLSGCVSEYDEANRAIREARAWIDKAEKELKTLTFTAFNKRTELKTDISDKYRTIEHAESRKTYLPEKYGFTGYAEEQIKTEFKSLNNIGSLTLLKDKIKAKKNAEVTSFRKLFYKLKNEEKAAICIKDDIRSGYTENAKDTVSKAFGEGFDLALYEKAVKKTDRSLCIDDPNRYMTKAKKETLTL